MKPQVPGAFIVFIYLFTVVIQSTLSQNPTSYFYENEFEIAFPFLRRGQ